MSSAPAPQRPLRPILHQRWSDLAFLHWKVDPALIGRRLPPDLEVDCHEGVAWVAIVPFFMSRIRFGPFPPLPGLRAFPELNLRTYVRHRDGRPGVWFFSLEADHGLAVSIGRKFFHLPYHDTSILLRREDDGSIDFRARRRDPAVRASFTTLRLRYRPRLEAAAPASPGSLEEFLCERYRFFSVDRGGRLYEGRVSHAPYVVGPVEVTVCDADLFRWNELPLPVRPPDHVLGARALEIQAPWVRRA
jgi:uncharacterized protein